MTHPTKMENRFGCRAFLGAAAGCYKGAHIEISAPYHEWVGEAKRQIESHSDVLHALETLVHRIDNPLEFGHAEDMAHRLTRAREAIAKARGE